MHNYCKIIGAMAAASALVAGNAQAGTETVATSAPAPAVESGINYELHAGYSSEYLFRGINLGTDLVEAGFDVSAEYAGLGFSAGAWYGSYKAPTGFGNPVADSNADELDIYAEVSKDLGFATVAVGYIYYYFPQGDANELLVPIEDAQEAYASISRDFGFAEIGVTYYQDIETDNDGYTALDISKSFELTSCLTLNVGGTLGYLVEEGHLSHFTTKVSVDYAFTENAKFSPFVAHSFDLSGGHFDDVITTSSAPATKNELIGGAMISASF